MSRDRADNICAIIMKQNGLYYRDILLILTSYLWFMNV